MSTSSAAPTPTPPPSQPRRPPPAPPSSTAPSSTTTSSSVPPKPSPLPLHLALDKTSFICDKASLSGTLTIGASTVIHPTARITAPPTSSIAIGSHCLISEGCVVEAAAGGVAMVIGNWNLMEAGSVVRGGLGHANWVRVGGEVGVGGRVGRGVEVGVRQRVDGVVQDGSLIMHDGSERRVEDTGVTVKEREKRVMEMLHLTLALDRDLLSKAHQQIH